jgi:hypothetical protein
MKASSELEVMNSDPAGLNFYDNKSKRRMKLVYSGHYLAGWILYKHPDGQWVTLRKATEADLNTINSAVIQALHAE